MPLSHTTTAETVPALLATIQELHALQQPLIEALQRIHGDMENARSGGDEWASEWTVQVWNELPLAVRAAGGDQDAAQELAATVRDAARTAAARQTTGQDDTETAPCSGPVACGDEPCDRHERQQAHAEGEHALCGPECECTCASAGPEFDPAGYYRDCPQCTEPEAPAHPAVNPACTTCKAAPAVGQLAEAHGTDRAVARVRAWIESEPVTARSEFGNGYREALRDITDVLNGRQTVEDER